MNSQAQFVGPWKMVSLNLPGSGGRSVSALSANLGRQIPFFLARSSVLVKWRRNGPIALQNRRLMRRVIESAPRDGKFVILEEDAGGNQGVARWSSEAGGWVGEDGEPINIAPTHWYPTQGENHLQQGLDFSFFLRRAAEQRATSDDVLTPCSVAAGPVIGAEVGAQTTPVEAKRVS